MNAFHEQEGKEREKKVKSKEVNCTSYVLILCDFHYTEMLAAYKLTWNARWNFFFSFFFFNFLVCATQSTVRYQYRSNMMSAGMVKACIYFFRMK